MAMAHSQSEPQRLLFTFAEQEFRNNSKDDFSITPVMSIEKTLDELSNFDALAAEAEQTGQPWNMVFIAGMLGQNGELPSVEAANKRLDMMIQAIHQGQFKGMITYNRDGEPMELFQAKNQ
jgi:hypothetical protein